jgi:hypothetical protein
MKKKEVEKIRSLEVKKMKASKPVKEEYHACDNYF